MTVPGIITSAYVPRGTSVSLPSKLLCALGGLLLYWVKTCFRPSDAYLIWKVTRRATRRYKDTSFDGNVVVGRPLKLVKAPLRSDLYPDRNGLIFFLPTVWVDFSKQNAGAG